jgi:penicillin-binding protein 2
MYNRRIKIFVGASVLFLLILLLRLVQMQLLPSSSVQDEIAQLKLSSGLSRQLKTVRGGIFDCKGRLLAFDELRFQLHVNYRLTCFADPRVQRAELLQAAQKPDAAAAETKAGQTIKTGLENIQQVIDKCTYFGLGRSDIEEKIKSINDEIWNLRTFAAWRRNDPDQNLIQKYTGRMSSIPLSEVIADFETRFPSEEKRLLLIGRVDDIAEMDAAEPLLELKTDDDIFTAQFEFMHTDGVQILPEAKRVYPYGSAAAQTIGWVGLASQEEDKKLFADDRLARYLDNEVCGREDGAEYVCETVLRGRRGEEIYDLDRSLISETETQLGRDVTLTLDIELQKKIESYLLDRSLNPNCKMPTAAVVIDVEKGDILALVSTPTFDLSNARYNYRSISSDPNTPLINRALNKQYPPGSVIKPVILIAGLEDGKITPDEIISCPPQKAPLGWPSCWLYNIYGSCHDYEWQNNARNAIKGSCNIYFSHLADRLDPRVLQQWLFKFGYGRHIQLSPFDSNDSNETPVTAHESRDFRQEQGQISTDVPNGTISSFEQLPSLIPGERRYFGMGQGNLRVTALQVANAFAAIARGGIFEQPKLFKKISDPEFKIRNAEGFILGISPLTLEVVRDGMSAVVNEPGGTAYNSFAYRDFGRQGVKVYGKTGSTEKPDSAWFAGFAESTQGRSISIVVVVEGGQSGPRDAAPLARDIIQFCIEAGYIGKPYMHSE